jgi:hypothetical protein
VQPPLQPLNMFPQLPQQPSSQRPNVFEPQSKLFQAPNVGGVFPVSQPFSTQPFGIPNNPPPPTQTFPYSATNNINRETITNQPFPTPSPVSPFGMFNQQPHANSTYNAPEMFVASNPSVAL